MALSFSNFMRYKYIILSIVVLSLVSCTGANTSNDGNSKDDSVDPLVAYCNNINCRDTVALHDHGAMKRLMADVVKLMLRADRQSVDKALPILFAGIDGDSMAIELVSEYATLYLGNPASPVRNEDLYICFLESMLAADGLPDAVRLRAAESLRLASLNLPGSVATDFDFVSRDGRQQSLHGVEAEQMLLLFYDPECPHCPDILERIADDHNINSAIADGSLTVLAVYAEGKRDVWENSCGELPPGWIVGYDLSGILEHDLYNLPAMPIIYLLDRDKRVLLKDPDVRSLLSR